jgi:LacI family transcriptional regulator
LFFVSTIHDVAKRAGVAPITVSRVVNKNGYVSEEKRKRVETAILELNYIPNALGPSLRSKRTQTLALVLSDITNPFWTTVARGVEDAANKHGYHVIMGNTDESPEKQEEYLIFLQKKQVDGFLIVPTSTNSSTLLRRLRVPFVVLDRRIPDDSVDTVRGDSIGGAYELTKHLLQLGHRHIAIITGRRDHSTACDRVAGFQQALEEFGLADVPQHVHWGDFNPETGYEYTWQALRTSPRPTAIFATNNFIAIGTMLALREAGIQVPEQMSVVAFDDLPAAITFDPFLTVAAQPAYEMGQQATEMLLSRLAGNGPPTHQEIVLPVEIIVRKSSGKKPDINSETI